MDGRGEGRGGLRGDEGTRAKETALEEKNVRASVTGADDPREPPCKLRSSKVTLRQTPVIKRALSTQGTVLIIKVTWMKHLLCALSDLSP